MFATPEEVLQLAFGADCAGAKWFGPNRRHATRVPRRPALTRRPNVALLLQRPTRPCPRPSLPLRRTRHRSQRHRLCPRTIPLRSRALPCLAFACLALPCLALQNTDRHGAVECDEPPRPRWSVLACRRRPIGRISVSSVNPPIVACVYIKTTQSTNGPAARPCPAPAPPRFDFVQASGDPTKVKHAVAKWNRESSRQVS